MNKNTKYLDDVEIRESTLFPGIYASEDGRVVGLRGKWLKQNKQARGYCKISYRLNGKLKSAFVHRITASAWQNYDQSKNICDHINGNVQDNHNSNLRWTTVQGNSKNRKAHRTGAKVGVWKRGAQWKVLIQVGIYDHKEDAIRALEEALAKLA